SSGASDDVGQRRKSLLPVELRLRPGEGQRVEALADPRRQLTAAHEVALQLEPRRNLLGRASGWKPPVAVPAEEVDRPAQLRVGVPALVLGAPLEAERFEPCDALGLEPPLALVAAHLRRPLRQLRVDAAKRAARVTVVANELL